MSDHSVDELEALYRRGEEALDAGKPEEAVRLLQRAVELEPDDADVRHCLALAFEALGDHEAMTKQLLQVRLLDAENDRRAGLGTPEELAFIEEVAVEVMSHLPQAFRERLGSVPVVLERRPSLAVVREGFDPRALGLFEGPSILDEDATMPARVVLFTHNLLAAFTEREELAEQIEITVLHEIGHYFGLDEDDMERLELD